MQPPSPSEVTRLLKDWSRGDSSALDQLMPILYDELRAVAARYLRRERQDHTLQPTALVNEAYLRLIDQGSRSLSLTPRLIAVASGTVLSQTVSTVCFGETVETVQGNEALQFTAINRGVNETGFLLPSLSDYNRDPHSS